MSQHQEPAFDLESFKRERLGEWTCDIEEFDDDFDARERALNEVLDADERDGIQRN